jgi:hypothetical protein
LTGWNTLGTDDDARTAERDLQLFHRHVVDRLVDVILQRLALQHAGHLAEQRQRPVRDGRFVHVHRDALQREAVVAGRVQRADHAAGTGADHDVRVDALRLEGLDHADVGEAARGAAAEGQADLDLARWRHDDRDGGDRRGGNDRRAAAAASQQQGAERDEGEAS